MSRTPARITALPEQGLRVMSQLVQIIVNGQTQQVAPGISIAALLAALGVEPRHVAVEINEDVVPRSRHAERTLAPGDRVEVVTLVGGG